MRTSSIHAGFTVVPQSRLSLHPTPSGSALGTNLGTIFIRQTGGDGGGEVREATLVLFELET